MSSTPLSNSPRPRACSSGRSVCSRIPAPRPWSRSAGSSPFRSFAQALGHPGAAHDNPRRTLWRWSRPRASRSAASNDPPAVPRHATSSHHSRPTLTPRSDPRAELRYRARRALQAPPAAQTGSAFPLTTGSAFLLGPTRRIIDRAGVPGVRARRETARHQTCRA